MNQSYRKRQILNDLNDTWNPKVYTHRKRNQISSYQRQGLRMMEELGEGCQKVQNSSYKINKH